MDRDTLLSLVRGLNDVELAILLCLVGNKHCLVTTDPASLGRLQSEVEIIAAQAFGLQTATVHCTPDITLDEFASALLIAEERRAISPLLTPDAERPSTFTPTGRKRIAPVLLLRDLENASHAVQALVLELMRTRKLTTSRSTYDVPDRFLILGILPKATTFPAGLLKHLREAFFISHHHEYDDEFDITNPVPSDTESSDSFASVVIRKHPPSPPCTPGFPIFTLGRNFIPGSVVDTLRALAQDVVMDTEIRRYLLDIIVFLRMHRAVKGGVVATGTADLEWLAKCLAPMHALDFVTPALVALAVFKVYNHRIELVQRTEDERSILWGSDPKEVEAYLKQVEVETVIEDVLASVKAPL
ncbi:hypothetical protein BZA77DRAFT_385204 [Pyronema omphalodes]|nr:hypothetical protein BZA77DRAFT_385204 [Pyronema omphalodes]